LDASNEFLIGGSGAHSENPGCGIRIELARLSRTHSIEQNVAARGFELRDRPVSAGLCIVSPAHSRVGDRMQSLRQECDSPPPIRNTMERRARSRDRLFRRERRERPASALERARRAGNWTGAVPGRENRRWAGPRRNRCSTYRT
jgi:hypothetical protein